MAMTLGSQTRMRLRHMVSVTWTASIWGIAFVLSKVGRRSITPPQLTLLRCTCAAVGVLWLARPAMFKPASRNDAPSRLPAAGCDNSRLARCLADHFFRTQKIEIHALIGLGHRVQEQ